MRPLLAAILLLTLAVTTAAEPAAAGLVAGDRIRYTLHSGEAVEAVVLESGPPPSGVAGWLVRPTRGSPTWLADGGVVRLDVFREKGPLVMPGFLIGLAVGAGFGATMAADTLASWGCLDYEGDGACVDPEARLVIAAFFGGTIGGIGALIGKLIEPERWDTLVSPARRRRLSLTPLSGPRGRGVGLALRVAF
jgi:hypothetical protein